MSGIALQCSKDHESGNVEIVQHEQRKIVVAAYIIYLERRWRAQQRWAITQLVDSEKPAAVVKLRR